MKSQSRIIKILGIVFAIIISSNTIAATINVPGDHATIQAAINASTNGDIVLIQPGTYYEHINFNGKAITVGSLFLTTEDESYISTTIINGSGSGRCVAFTSGETSTSELTGLTITNGGAYYGAGIYCQGTSPTLSYLEILNNHGDAGDSYGGGLCCMDNGATPTCTNLTFTGNDANEGGAVYCHNNAHATFSDCVFTNNTSSHGGAMQISYSSPEIDHSLFYENDSPFGGAVYVYNYSTPEFINCTFSDNTSTYGGAFYLTSLQGQPTITNCILFNNVCSYNLEIFVNSSVYPPIVTYTDVEGASGETWFGTGCLDTDPLFADASNDDYTLTESSPCIDAGDPASPPDEDGSIADQGAYPYLILFSADFFADNTQVCLGSTVQFTDASVGTPTSWNWTFEGGTPPTSTDENPSVTYNSIGEFDVTLEVSDSEHNSTIVKIDYILVSVTPDQASTPQGPTEVCGGGEYDYSTTAVTGATYYEWLVDPVDAGTISGSGINVIFNAAAGWSGDYTISVRAANQCGEGAWSESIACTLFLNSDVYELNDGGNYCEGGDGIEITQDGSDVGINYELFYEGVTTGTIVAGTGDDLSYGFFFNPGNYTAVGSSGSCVEDMLGASFIVVDNLPELATTPSGSTSVCGSTTTDYTCEPIVGADTIYWTLTPTEAGTFIGNGENISIVWNTDYSGLASLTTQGHNTCGFGDESDALEINCSLTPTPEITGLALVCDNENADYEVGDIAGSTYDWIVTGGDIIDGAGTNFITVLWGDAGASTVELTQTLENCIGTSEVFDVTIDDCTGFEEINDNVTVIYPNPASDFITIKNTKVVNFEIHNMIGALVLQGNTKDNTSVDISSLENGIYVIVITSDSDINVQKIIID